MRPHEETWTMYQSGIANHGVARKNPTRTVATRIATFNEAMLIAAAPEMARALVRMLDAFPAACASPEEHEARTEALRALTRAGVIS